MPADAGLPRARTAWLDEVFGNLGYADALREVSREGDQFSWWPDSEQAEMLNLGWRFDYQVLTPACAASCATPSCRASRASPSMRR